MWQLAGMPALATARLSAHRREFQLRNRCLVVEPRDSPTGLARTYAVAAIALGLREMPAQLAISARADKVEPVDEAGNGNTIHRTLGWKAIPAGND